MFELRAKSNKETDVMMYGSISEWGRVRAEDFIRAIASAKQQGYEKVNLKIHSPGGSVFEGLAIISQMNDGVDIYAKKTGKDAKWILDNWMAEGKDTWFTAEQALKEGLIDGIIEGKVQPMPKEQSATFLEMAAHYDQFFKNKSENKMDRDELIALLGLEAEATDADIKAALEAKKPKAQNTPKKTTKENASDEGADDTSDVVEGIVALAKERGMNDKQIESLKIVAKINPKAAMGLIPSAGEAGTADEEDADDKKKDTISVKALLEDLKKNAGGTKAVASDKKNWDFDEWSKHPKDFEALLKTNPSAYQKLFEAKFNYKPSLEELTDLTFKH